ncbi:hypothetical protein ACWDSJ_28015 [Nocardia sp. NPDC003482]
MHDRPTRERIVMRDVITPPHRHHREQPPTPSTRAAAGPARRPPDHEQRQPWVWNPETSVPATTFRWDLLATITDAADADHVAEHLLSVVDEAARFFVPEAALLAANLLLAAARGQRTLPEVLAWIRHGDLREPYRLLRARGETGPVADLDAFAHAPAGEQAAIWAVARQALLPLDHGPLLAALSPHPHTEGEDGHLPVLDPAALAPGRTIVVVATPGSRSAGAAAALRATLERAAQQAGVAVKVVTAHTQPRGA